MLAVSDYRDDDRLAKVLTAEHGLVSVLLRGVKKAKAKLKPFAQCFAVFDTRLVGRGGFLTPVEPMLIRDGFALCSDLRVFAAASVAAEATLSAICDGEPHTDMFLEFLKLEKALYDYKEPYYQAAVFMTRILEYAGYFREYAYDETPKTPVRMLGYAQRRGYADAENADDLSRRAFKYACAEYERAFDTELKSAQSIDLYA